MTSQRKITAVLVAKPGKEAEALSLLKTLMPASRNEPGCLRWDIWRDQSDPAKFVLDELYVDDGAVAAHRASPHFQTYAAAIVEVADRTAVVSAPVDVAP